jgi:hypothetical protein
VTHKASTSTQLARLYMYLDVLTRCSQSIALALLNPQPLTPQFLWAS